MLQNHADIFCFAYRAKKNCVYTMETESEGVLLTKGLSLDARLIYHFPSCYTRITPTTFVPSHGKCHSVFNARKQ